MSRTGRPRTVVLRGGRIRTLDRARPLARALVVRGSRIAAVLEDATDAPANAEVYELDGACVLPGFTDAHVHLPSWARAHHGPELGSARALDEALDVVAAWLKAHGDRGIVRGRGWRADRWPDSDRPTRWALDRVAGERPAMLTSHDGHSLWLNSAALALAGGELTTSGGVVELDAGGEPTGVIREQAAARYEARVPPSFDEALAALREALPRLAAGGVVAVHDKDGHRRALDLHRALERSGDLPVRVWQSLPAERLDRLDEATTAPPDRSAADGPGVRVGYVKVFMDGTLGSRTARLLDGSGVEVTSVAELCRVVERAARRHVPVAAHAIGDRAVRDALDGFEATRPIWGPLGLRHRIEHAQCVHPDDLPRFSALNVTASVQFTHATEDQELADAIWGDRAEHSYPYASLLAAGARIVAGSDAPYQEIDPLAGVRAAAFRTADGRPPWRPNQRIGVGDALAAFTREPAWLERAEASRGRLAGGLAADLVVLSDDPFERPGDARVRATMLAGRWIHEDHRLSPAPERKDEA